MLINELPNAVLQDVWEYVTKLHQEHVVEARADDIDALFAWPPPMPAAGVYEAKLVREAPPVVVDWEF